MLDMIDTKEFPFKERVCERNKILNRITGAYNDSITPSLLAYRAAKKVIEDAAQKEINEINERKRIALQKACKEYETAIEPHRRVYDVMCAQAHLDNPISEKEIYDPQIIRRGFRRTLTDYYLLDDTKSAEDNAVLEKAFREKLIELGWTPPSDA